MKNSHFYEGQAGKNTHVCQGWSLSFCIKTMLAIFVPLKGFEEGLPKGFSLIKVFWFSVSHIPSN